MHPPTPHQISGNRDRTPGAGPVLVRWDPSFLRKYVLKEISDEQYRALVELCSKNGGELLSGHFRTGRKIHIRCAEGHTWFPDMYNSLKGVWCNHPDCVSKSISDAKVAPILEIQT